MERGDVLELRGGRGAVGHEEHGRRYAIVLQAGRFWPASTLVVAPTSTSAHSREFRPVVRIRRRKTAVLVDQLAAFDITRFGDQVGVISADELAEIDSAVMLFLGLSGRF